MGGELAFVGQLVSLGHFAHLSHLTQESCDCSPNRVKKVEVHKGDKISVRSHNLEEVGLDLYAYLSQAACIHMSNGPKRFQFLQLVGGSLHVDLQASQCSAMFLSHSLGSG